MPKVIRTKKYFNNPESDTTLYLALAHHVNQISINPNVSLESEIRIPENFKANLRLMRELLSHLTEYHSHPLAEKTGTIISNVIKGLQCYHDFLFLGHSIPSDCRILMQK